jgi:hypothetical protein
VDSPLLKHHDDQLTHGVLDWVCGQDADTVMGLVRVELGVG